MIPLPERSFAVARVGYFPGVTAARNASFSDALPMVTRAELQNGSSCHALIKMPLLRRFSAKSDASVPVSKNKKLAWRAGMPDGGQRIRHAMTRDGCNFDELVPMRIISQRLRRRFHCRRVHTERISGFHQRSDQQIVRSNPISNSNSRKPIGL